MQPLFGRNQQVLWEGDKLYEVTREYEEKKSSVDEKSAFSAPSNQTRQAHWQARDMGLLRRVALLSTRLNLDLPC